MRTKVLTLVGLLMATTGIALGLLIGLSAIPTSPTDMKQLSYTASASLFADGSSLLGILVPYPTAGTASDWSSNCPFAISAATS